MKEGSLFVLFCTYEMLEIAFLVSLESSQGGAGHWLHFMVFGLVGSSQILNDFFTENSIKSQLKIVGELECAFGVVRKILMSGI
jgi:hypothetical protein